MDHIIDNIYIGSFDSSNSIIELNKNGIIAIINVAEELEPEIFLPNIEYYKYGVSSYIDVTYDALDNVFCIIQHESKKGAILLHCSEGISRSVIFCIYYIMKKHGKTVDEAIDIIRSNRKQANCNIFSRLMLSKYF